MVEGGPPRSDPERGALHPHASIGLAFWLYRVAARDMYHDPQTEIILQLLNRAFHCGCFGMRLSFVQSWTDGPPELSTALEDAWRDGAAETYPPIPSFIEEWIQRRADARSVRAYAYADRIRAEVAHIGVALEDATEGTRWKRIH